MFLSSPEVSKTPLMEVLCHWKVDQPYIRTDWNVSGSNSEKYIFIPQTLATQRLVVFSSWQQEGELSAT